MLKLGLIQLMYWDFVPLSIYNGQLGGGHDGEAIVGLFHIIAKVVHKFSLWNGHVVEVGGRGGGAVWHNHVLGGNCYRCFIAFLFNKNRNKIKGEILAHFLIGLIQFIHKWTINIQDCCGSSRMFSCCCQHTFLQTFFFVKWELVLRVQIPSNQLKETFVCTWTLDSIMIVIELLILLNTWTSSIHLVCR